MDSETKPNKHSVKAYFHSLFDMRSNMLTYDELHDMMEENTIIHGSNIRCILLCRRLIRLQAK